MAKKVTKQSTELTAPESEANVLQSRVSSVAATLMTSPKSADDAAVAVGHRSILKGIEKEVKEKKDGIIKPLNESIKRVRELFRPIENQLGEALELVTDGLSMYHTAVQEQLEAKRERLDERIEEGEITEEKASKMMAKASDKMGAAIIPIREVKVIKIVDESKIPDAYWVLDMVAIRRDAISEGIKIPGVEVVIEDQIFNRKG